MHRIDGAGHVDHLFVAEDPATLRPPTEITPEIMNAFQEELATFIEWAGIVLAKGNNTQLKQALLAKFVTRAGVQAQENTAFTTAGDSGAFVLTPNPAITAYGIGQRFRVKFHVAGNGADSINVSGLGGKNIKQYDSTGAKVAPVISANLLADVEYDGIDFVIIDQLPASVGTTAPQFDSSLKLATTAFVQRALGGFSGVVSYAANTILTADDVGKSVLASGTITLTLPAANAVSPGSCIEVFSNTGTVTVQRSGADALQGVGAGATSVALGVGDIVKFRSNGVSSWLAVAGSAQLPFSAEFLKYAIGGGQTWQDVKASRALNTTYTNTTGRPIALSVGGGNGTSTPHAIYALVGGVTIYGSSYSVSGTATTSLFVIIPPGATYSVVGTAGTTSIYSWAELR